QSARSCVILINDVHASGWILKHNDESSQKKEREYLREKQTPPGLRSPIGFLGPVPAVTTYAHHSAAPVLSKHSSVVRLTALYIWPPFQGSVQLRRSTGRGCPCNR